MSHRRAWTEDERRMAGSVRCPHCQAVAGAPCRTNLGRWADYHLGRVLLAYMGAVRPTTTG